MSVEKKIKFLTVAREGIAIANRGNIFWTKSDAFRHWNAAVNNASK